MDRSQMGSKIAERLHIICFWPIGLESKFNNEFSNDRIKAHIFYTIRRKPLSLSWYDWFNLNLLSTIYIQLNENETGSALNIWPNWLTGIVSGTGLRVESFDLSF